MHGHGKGETCGPKQENRDVRYDVRYENLNPKERIRQGTFRGLWEPSAGKQKMLFLRRSFWAYRLRHLWER